jgi:hypothetical protein
MVRRLFIFICFYFSYARRCSVIGFLILAWGFGLGVWAAVMSQVTVQLSSEELTAASVPVQNGKPRDLTEAGNQALLRDGGPAFGSPHAG